MEDLQRKGDDTDSAVDLFQNLISHMYYKSNQ